MDKYINLFFNISYILTDGTCPLCMNEKIHICDKICRTCKTSITKLIYNGGTLEKHKIFCKKDYIRWTIKNHPDKGGDAKIFAEVTELVRRRFG